jgi:ATP-dependent DNA helicase HFM1/MER3
VIRSHDGVKIQIQADIGFINEQPPQRFNNKLIYVCLLVDTSDGRKIHFARIRFVVMVLVSHCTNLYCSGPKLGSGQSIAIPALLTRPEQSINCYVMCDGTGMFCLSHVVEVSNIC